MILVSDLAAKGLPASFLNVLPEFCDCCDSPLQISETLTELRCSNPFCPEVVASRLKRFLRSVGFPDLELSSLTLLCDSLAIRSVYTVFQPGFDKVLTDYLTDGSSKSDRYLIGVLIGVRERLKQIPLWYYVRLGYFEDVSDYAYALLKDTSDLTAFYDDYVDTDFLEFQAYALPRIMQGKKVPDVDLDVLCLSLYSQFLTYREELIGGLSNFQIHSFTQQLGVLSVLDSDLSALGRLLLAYNVQLGSKLFLYCVDWLNNREPDFLWFPHDLALYAPDVLQDIRDNFKTAMVVNRSTLLALTKGVGDNIPLQDLVKAGGYV